MYLLSSALASGWDYVTIKQTLNSKAATYGQKEKSIPSNTEFIRTLVILAHNIKTQKRFIFFTFFLFVVLCATLCSVVPLTFYISFAHTTFTSFALAFCIFVWNTYVCSDAENICPMFDCVIWDSRMKIKWFGLYRWI